MKASLLITDEYNQQLSIKYDGERFALVEVNPIDLDSKTIILNLREANEVATFIEDNIDPDEGLELRPEIVEKLKKSKEAREE